MSWGSLQERKKAFLEDCCGGAMGGGDGGGPTMTVGADGFQADAAATGPRGGFTPLQKMRKNLDYSRKRRKGA